MNRLINNLLHRRWLVMTILIVLVLAFILSFWGRNRFGSFAGGVAFISGQRTILDREVLGLGSVRQGSSRTFRVSVRNLNSWDVKLLGANYSCTCSSLSGLPSTIPAGSMITLIAKINPRKKIGKLNESIVIFTDDPASRTLEIRIVGDVKPQIATEPSI